jgi:hypothetical protein
MKRLWFGVGLALACGVAGAQTVEQATPAAAVANSGGTIHGTVKAGAIPLPGVAVTATNTLTGKKYTTSTDVNGSFAMTIPKTGRYVVRAELAAFAPETKEVRITAEAAEQTAEFGMQLASRVAQQEKAAEGQTAQTAAAAITRGMQALSVNQGEAGLADASAGGGVAGAALPTRGGLGGLGPDSVTVSGQMGQTNGLANMSEDDIRQRITDAMDQARRQGGAAGDQMNAAVSMLGGFMGGGFGGPGGGGGRGGPGGGGGGRGGGGGGFRGFNPSQPHGTVFYQGSYGALNAIPFPVSGLPAQRTDNNKNSFGLSFAGSPQVPGLMKPNPKEFLFFNVSGVRNINPVVLQANVPTLAERGQLDSAGNTVAPCTTGADFSQLTQTVNGAPTKVQLYQPGTTTPYANNVIPTAALSKAACNLLQYYPAPNLPVGGNQDYNYQTVTTSGTNTTNAALRFVQNFGNQPMFGGRRSSRNAPAALRQNINFNGSYSHSAADNRNVFLPLGGATESTGYGVTAGYTIGYGRLTNNASLNWNRSHSNGFNYFTNGATNPSLTSGLAIGNSAAVQSQRFYYGLPSLTFTGFTGLTNSNPSDTIGQTISFSDFVSYNHKKHNMRFGVDIRRLHSDVFGGTNVLGSFQFSGCATQQATAAVPNPCDPPSTTTATATSASTPTGSGFADFLLGLPQQSQIQANASKIYLRENVFDWYAQDDWRILANVTLNFGLRYEYFGPYTEKNGRLTNVAHNADFTSLTLVCATVATGCTKGSPASLVNADHTMYSPRLGVAWRPKFTKETVVRGGYGINYNTGQYGRFAQLLADQQPFADSEINIAYKTAGCGTLQLSRAFGCSQAAVQSTYAVNPNYRLARVQIYNLGVQRTLPKGVVLNFDYNGSVGGNLDIVRLPNRTSSGLLNQNGTAFQYEDSLGFSRLNNFTFNARKRMQRGISLQATYAYGHSIDNASSINGTTATPAQNDKDLAAEESNSSFDVRHKLTGNWVFELPFGPNRAFLSQGGFWSKALDGFNVSGDFTFATGSYFTPQYTASATEVASGATTSLRPDRVAGVSVKGAGRLKEWFDPAAFTTPAALYGTASRNSIQGPGVVQVDASLSRTFALGSTRSFEGRVTGANVFNTVQYSGINTTLNSNNFGQVSSAASMRVLTFVGRYRF